jgi:hypothetical protein
MANYDYTVDYSFKPYSFQEMLAPYMLYKEAYDKAEERAIELSDKSDVFKYLSTELPEDSEARQIYEGYSNDLKRQADALGRHGLTLAIRGGLADMRKRFSGEIGRLERAKTNLDKVNALRLEMGAKDPTMLYATNNLSIDNFLDEKMPNMYGISGNDIYNAGLKTGAALANTQYSTGDGGNVIGGYYIDFVQRRGYDPATLLRDKEAISKEFKNELALTHPELLQAVESGLNRLGVTGNLTGAELNRARASMLDGIVDGAMASYQESHSPQRNLSKLTASESANIALRQDAQRRAEAAQGLVWKGDHYEYHKELDPGYARATARAGGVGKGGSGVSYGTTAEKPIRVNKNDGSVTSTEHKGFFKGIPVSKKALTDDEYVKALENKYVKGIVRDIPEYYDIYDSDDSYIIVPRKSSRDVGDGYGYGYGYSNPESESIPEIEESEESAGEPDFGEY